MPAGVRPVTMLAFPQAQMLDIVGPLEVFAAANAIRRAEGGHPLYSVEIRAREPGPVPTASGLPILATRGLGDVDAADIHTLLVAGGEGVEAARGDIALMAWLRAAGPRVPRLASVCTGAFLLAEAGLLAGRRATTHWMHCARFARDYPESRIEPDSIFVKDGRIWCSAGITAGMDMALAMVEEDHDRGLALAVARRLVLFLKRPGGQAQFSAQLAAQGAASAPIARVQSRILDNPGGDLRVERLAEFAGMSVRTFARAFARETGTTPARFVERARVDAARRAIEDGAAGLDPVARRCGFGSADTMRRVFAKVLGVGPREYRQRVRPNAAAGQPVDPVELRA
ncbi:MAG: GlxA family transcriptional regulator [Alphaproteobacteria bacterium]